MTEGINVDQSAYIFRSDPANCHSNIYKETSENNQLLHTQQKIAMAFIGSIQRFQTPNNFIATILLTVIMSCVVLSAPTTDASSNSSGTQGLIGQVFKGLEILIGLGSRMNGTILGIEDFQNVSLINH